MRRTIKSLALAFFTIASMSACGSAPCDEATLQAELDAAAAGDVVEVGSCTVAGTIEVPAGVTLRGVDGTILAGVGDTTTVTLRDGAALEAVEVQAELGRGVMVEGPGSARLTGVTIVGPVDEGAADVLPPMPGSDQTATHGLVIRDAGSAEAPVTLRDVTVRGFGRFGAVFVGSHVDWEGGAARENLGVGLMTVSGSVRMTDVSVCSTFRGLSPYGYGAVFRDGTDVRSENLELCDNQSAGALHDDVTVAHVGLEARGNRDAGLWVQDARAFSLDGSALSDNALAGMVLVQTPSITVRDTTIGETRSATRLLDGREIQAGDGIHLIAASAGEVVLDGVTMSGNPRVGLLMEIADGTIPAGALSAVVVEASGDAFGAVAQTGSDTLSADVFGPGLERRGAAVANDAAVPDRLGVLGVVAPMFLPPPPP